MGGQPKIPQWLRDLEDTEVAKHNPPMPPTTDGCAWKGGECPDNQTGCPHC